VEVSCHIHNLATLPLREQLYLTIRGWVGLKTGMDALEKRENLLLLAGIEPQFLDHLTFSTIIISNELPLIYITNEIVKHPLHFNCKVSTK
jgi:hypothetical protein